MADKWCHVTSNDVAADFVLANVVIGCRINFVWLTGKYLHFDFGFHKQLTHIGHAKRRCRDVGLEKLRDNKNFHREQNTGQWGIESVVSSGIAIRRASALALISLSFGARTERREQKEPIGQRYCRFWFRYVPSQVSFLYGLTQCRTRGAKDRPIIKTANAVQVEVTTRNHFENSHVTSRTPAYPISNTVHTPNLGSEIDAMRDTQIPLDPSTTQARKAIVPSSL
jgi:hypothetical protein